MYKLLSEKIGPCYRLTIHLFWRLYGIVVWFVYSKHLWPVLWLFGYASIPIFPTFSESLYHHNCASLIILHHNFCNQPFFALYFTVWENSRGFYSTFHSLYPFHISIPFTSLSISPLSLYLSFYLSFFSLSFSLAYIMDVLVLVIFAWYRINAFNS